MTDNFCNIFIKKKTPLERVLDVALNVVLVVMIALLCVIALFEPISVQGKSMLPTILDGDRVAISRLDKSYERGDIVVVKKQDYYIIKRVIATEGDVLAFAWSEGQIRVFVNDLTTPIEEHYINQPMNNMSPDRWSKVSVAPDVMALESGYFSITLGEGELFLMGDNRNHSTDSRADGAYKESSVKGKMSFNITESKLWSFIFDIIQLNKESTNHD